MTDEGSSNQGTGNISQGQGWSPGGPDVGEMDGNAVTTEIYRIESDPSFAGEGVMPYHIRQQMLKRRNDLYGHDSRRDPGKEAAYEAGLDGMYDQLSKLNVTKESIDAQQQAFKERDLDEQIAKSRRELEFKFGGKDEADKQLKVAKDVLSRYANQDDLYFIDESGLGNNADFIQLLSRLGGMLEKARRGRR